MCSHIGVANMFGKIYINGFGIFRQQVAPSYTGYSGDGGPAPETEAER